MAKRKPSGRRKPPPVYGTYTGRPKRGRRPEVQVVVVEDRGVVPHLPGSASARPKKKAARRNHKSWVGELPIVVSRFAWRYRWRLTPIVAWILAFAGLAANVPGTLGVVIGVGSVAYASAYLDVEFKKRKLLSRQERLLIVQWCIGALAVGIIELLTGDWNWRRVMFTLTAATSWPAYRWIVGRQPTRPKAKLSKEGAERLKLWARVGKYSEGTLKGSTIVSGTAHEPTTGTLVFTVQLRADVHGKSAESEVVWRKVETLVGLPPDTVRIKCHRDNATRAVVTMAASRYLEHHTVEWTEPRLTDDGAIILGDTPAGETVDIPRYDDKGVKHARITGNTGNGKSTTCRVISLARASATVAIEGIVMQEEVQWLIDGKRGTSVPEIRNVFDWYATTDDEWPLALDAVKAVMLDRQLRRGKAGLSAWRPGTERDPILTLYVAESSAVRRSLLERGLAKRYDRLALDILQHGRALGVAMEQEAQDAIADNWLGGRQARELMSKGAAIMHRPGGSTGQQYAGDGAAERQALLKLPDVDGFAAVVVNGKPRADVMRVGWCSEEKALAWAEPFVSRTLEGADALAAGPAYANRTHGREELNAAPEAVSEPVAASGDSVQSSPVAPTRAPARVEAPNAPLDRTGPDSDDAHEPTEQELTNSRKWVLLTLQWNRAGLTANELIERAAGKRGLGRSSMFGHLAWLVEHEQIGKDGDTYFAIRKDKEQ